MGKWIIILIAIPVLNTVFGNGINDFLGRNRKVDIIQAVRQEQINAIMEKLETIEEAIKELKDKEQIQVLDIACGPGNLTFDLEEKLKNEFPNTEINLTGLSIVTGKQIGRAHV